MCEIRSDTVSLRRLTDKPIDVILHNLQDESECSRTVLSQRTLVIFYQCKYCLYDLCSDIIHDITYIFYCFILSFLDSSYYSLLTRLNSKIKLNYSSEKVLKKKVIFLINSYRMFVKRFISKFTYTIRSEYRHNNNGDNYIIHIIIVCQTY